MAHDDDIPELRPTGARPQRDKPAPPGTSPPDAPPPAGHAPTILPSHSAPPAASASVYELRRRDLPFDPARTHQLKPPRRSQPSEPPAVPAVPVETPREGRHTTTFQLKPATTLDPAAGAPAASPPKAFDPQQTTTYQLKPRSERPAGEPPSHSPAIDPIAPRPTRHLDAADADDADDEARVRRADLWRAAALNLGIGLAIAVVCGAIPPARGVVDVLMTIIHELGHAASSWLFGYPAIPALDLRHGGGLTPSFARSLPVAVVAATCVAVGVASQYRRRLRLLLAIGLAGLYAWLSLSPWHEAVILAMGHGLVLVVSAVFLVRGLAGVSLERPYERPVYVALGLLMPLIEARRAQLLITDLAYRQDYLDAKDGVVLDDLTRLSFEYSHTSFESAAAALLAGSFASILIAGTLSLALLISFHRHAGAERDE